ncbi:MAG: hypothetical protein Q9201_004170 [Fulgogasparrea decipioides]
MPPPGRRRLPSLTLLLSLLFLFASTASAVSAVLGIDLGTEYIKTALVKPGIPLEIVLTKDSKRKEAAVVAFKSSKSSPSDSDAFPERIYGGDALTLSARFPSDVYPNLKPLLGQHFQTNDLVSVYKDRFPELNILGVKERGTVGFLSSSFGQEQEPFLVEELLAMELKNIRANAVAMAGKGSTIKDVVVTIPPFYTAEEKRAVIMAVDLAGMRVLSLISDGLAVGLNYATSRTFPTINEGGKPEVHLVYDMGAGSASATILRFQGRTVKDVGKFNKTIQEVQVLGIGWDKYLGGDALNQVIVDDMVEKFANSDRMKKLGTEARDIKKHGRTMAKLWKESERLRQVLSANTETQAGFEGLYHDDVNFKYKITRADFEKLSTKYAAKVKAPITLALESAKLRLSDLESIILHGGAVRTPFVQKELEFIVGTADKIRTNVNSDEAAVFGAAFKAAGISPSFRVKEIRTGDTPAYASGAWWTTDGKEKQQKLFTPTSVIGAEKQVAFKFTEDFPFTLYQRVPSRLGEMVESPISEIQTKNLTTSVKKLEDSFGCLAADISTKFAIRLSPTDGLPEVVRGSVSCEVTEKRGGVVDGMKDLFGFGAKKGDQKPLAEEGEGEESSTTSTESETATTASPKESPTADPTASEQKQEEKPKEAKKRTETIYIDFASEPVGLPQLTDEELGRIKDRLFAFDKSDNSRIKREETLNTLEAFTYKARDLLEDESFISASTDIQRTEIENKFKAASEWLYGDGADATREILKERLDELRGLVNPVLKRKDESVKRPEAIKSLQEALSQVKVMVDVVKQAQESYSIGQEMASSTFSSSSETSSSSPSTTSTTAVDDFADLDDDTSTPITSESTTTSTPSVPQPPPYTPEDLTSLISTRDKVQSWLDGKLAEQEKLSPSDDPVILSSELQAKSTELNQVVMKIIQKQMKATRSPPPPPKNDKKGGKKGGGKGAKKVKSMDIEDLLKDMPKEDREEIERAVEGAGETRTEETAKEMEKLKEGVKKKTGLKHEEL